jgi:hypothetical protein
MKKTLKLVPLIALGSLLLLLPACSKSNSQVRIGMDYKNNRNSDLQSSAFSSTVYVFFNDHVVSVYKEISAKGDIARLKSDGTLQSSSDRWDLRIGAPKGSSLSKGTDETTRMEVLFGPGDWMPVLEYAPYKIEGTSVYVDWSQHHSVYFVLSGCGSGSEVFTIKNEGLVLESATTPGFTLTLDASGKSHGLSSFEERQHEQRQQYEENQRELREKLQKLRGQ